MNQLRPILRGNPTRAQKLVLGSARLDQPPRHGPSQTLAALGLSGTLMATTQVVTAATAASAGSTTAATATGSLVGLGAAGLKGIVAGLLAGSVMYGAIVAVRGGEVQSVHSSEQQGQPRVGPLSGGLRPFESSGDAARVASMTTKPDAAPRAVAPSASPQGARSPKSTYGTGASSVTARSRQGPLPPAKSPPVLAAVDFEKDLPQSEIASAPLTTGVAAARVTGSLPAAHSSKAREQSHLESEIAILDSAQRALAAGQPALALQRLDAHHRLFTHPHLLPEATLVQIQALLALGRAVEARRLGERLLAAQPTSALAQRVNSLIGPAPRP